MGFFIAHWLESCIKTNWRNIVRYCENTKVCSKK